MHTAGSAAERVGLAAGTTLRLNRTDWGDQGCSGPDFVVAQQFVVLDGPLASRCVEFTEINPSAFTSWVPDGLVAADPKCARVLAEEAEDNRPMKPGAAWRRTGYQSLARGLPDDLVPRPGDGAPRDPSEPWRYHVLGINIRFFQAVNVFGGGHDHGDRVLALLERSVDDLFPTQTVIRWMTNEYVVILPRAQCTATFAGEIQRSLAATLGPSFSGIPYVHVQAMATSFSFDAPHDANRVEALALEADNALSRLPPGT